MFHLLEKRIAEAFASRIESLYGVAGPAQTEQPKQSSFGEIAVPAAFQLARQLKKAPKAIAAELSTAVGAIEGVSAIEIAGNGYLNLRLDRGYYAAGLLAGDGAAARGDAARRSSSSTPTSIPTRPRTSAICAMRFWAIRSCACCARRAGNVEVQNYIDNTGVQVADVVVGFRHLEKKIAGGSRRR